MASIATWYDKIFGGRETAATQADIRVWEDERALPRANAGPFSLRPLPNEDILLFVKRFDNSRVAPADNPGARGTALKVAAGSLATAALLVMLLAPSALGLLAGYQIEALEKERNRLIDERATLQLEEATLLSPARIAALSRDQEFIDPEPAALIYLEPKREGSVLALNGGNRIR